MIERRPDGKPAPLLSREERARLARAMDAVVARNRQWLAGERARRGLPGAAPDRVVRHRELDRAKRRGDLDRFRAHAYALSLRK
jgi:hypothetical protein